MQRGVKKILTQEEKLINAYCRHLSRGYSEESFPDAEWSYVEKLAKETDEKNGGENYYFHIIKVSKRQGRLLWEKIGMNGILTENKKFNGSAWMFVMKNRYGWKLNPKEEKKEENKIIKVKLGFENEDSGENT